MAPVQPEIRQSLASLYEDEASGLLRVAFALLQNTCDAEEVVQDAASSFGAAGPPRTGRIDRTRTGFSSAD